jgi:GntR family transcriptional regulator
MILTDPDRPFWKQLADALREQVITGQLAPGDPLPAEAELMREFGSSRTSVRRAVAQLRAEGLLEVFAAPPSGGVRHVVAAVEVPALYLGDALASVGAISVTRANGSIDIYPPGTVFRRG